MSKSYKSFPEKVYLIVSRIPTGSFLTYSQVAKRAGSPKAARAVGNILAKNKDKNIPCHRVIKSDLLVGGYRKNKKDSFKKAGLLVKEGAIGVIPTDTIYGLIGSALKEEVVERIYSLRKRSLQKPVIILILCKEDLTKFKIKTSSTEEKFLKKAWPGKVSVILNCPSEDFAYLHRNKKSLAFRVPKKKELRSFLKTSGPVVAPSANIEGMLPARNIKEAKKYFQESVFYLNRGIISEKPSTLVRINGDKREIIRE